MIPKKNRLPSYRIQEVLRGGKKTYAKSVALFSIPQGTAGDTQLAVIIPVKVARLAVTRNRIKRLVRESIRRLVPKLCSGFYTVCMVQKDISNYKEPKVRLLMKQVFMKAGLLCDTSL